MIDQGGEQESYIQKYETGNLFGHGPLYWGGLERNGLDCLDTQWLRNM